MTLASLTSVRYVLRARTPAQKFKFFSELPHTMDKFQKKVNSVQGIRTFSTLEEAVRFGFTLFERTPYGDFVRIKTAAGWALAVIPAAQS
jgi:hypothetical protein